jgi:hypothetical protein
MFDGEMDENYGFLPVFWGFAVFPALGELAAVVEDVAPAAGELVATVEALAPEIRDFA